MNRSKALDPRFWTRWQSAGSLESVLTEPEIERLLAEKVVKIAGDLYCKTRLAYQALMTRKRASGYEIPDHARQKPDKGSTYIHLTDDALKRCGKCRSCGELISSRGIRSHMHRCEKCGEPTYLEFTDGGTIEFYWHNDEESRAPVKLKVKDYDQSRKLVICYAEPLESRSLWSQSVEESKAQIAKRMDRLVRISDELIGIPYDTSSAYLTPESVINPAEIRGERYNHEIVKVYQGKVYSEWDHIDIPESYSIYHVWTWKTPRLKPSPKLHEEIIGAARMVSRCDYYYQDGRAAFYDNHLHSMRTFVEHFTTLDLAAWDRMIGRAPRSGPGMIRAIAAFCHNAPVITDEPNIGNLLYGFSKFSSGERLTQDEITAMANAAQDPEVMGEFVDVFGNKGRRVS